MFEVRHDSHRYPIPLTQDDQTIVSFTADSSGPMVLTYNAECHVQGKQGAGFLGISFKVDGKDVNPYKVPYVLCSGDADSSPGAPVSAVHIAPVDLKKSDSPHTIEIIGQGKNTVDWYISSTVLSLTQ
jgi:hypothetical protein